MSPEQRVRFLEAKLELVERENEDLRVAEEELRELLIPTKYTVPAEWQLTATEKQILVYLTEHRKPLSKDNYHIVLATYANRIDVAPDPKILDVFVHKTRAKLKAVGYPNVIDTLWGSGYHINSEEVRAWLKAIMCADASADKSSLQFPEQTGS